ncbi:MAG: hypothetical protein ACKVPJ_13520 [Chitinophagales bacterium]
MGNSKKFVKLSNDDIAKLSPEDKLGYYESMAAEYENALAEIALLKEDNANFQTTNDELTAALNSGQLSMASGKIMITHEGKQYNVNSKFARCNCGFGLKNYNIDFILGNVPAENKKEAEALRKFLLGKKSGILTEVK